MYKDTAPPQKEEGTCSMCHEEKQDADGMVLVLGPSVKKHLWGVCVWHVWGDHQPQMGCVTMKDTLCRAEPESWS